MTASPALNQLQADVYGRPVLISKDPEATAFGCLLTALCGQGEYPSVQAAFDALARREEEVYVPDLKKTEEYRRKREEMDALYQSIRKGQQT